MLRIDELKIYDNISEQDVLNRGLKKYGILREDVVDWKIVKKSVDSRNKKDVHFSYSLNIEVKDEDKYPKVKKVEVRKKEQIIVNRNSEYAPVIVGSGPAGLFCALTLVENGVKPIIIEQGAKVDERIKWVEQYRNTGKLNPLCNVQFGEGGAGTFSDGKLTTGINSPYVTDVLETFYRFGAPQEVTYLSKPHIGTDNLVNIIKNIREYIESKGGQYYFNTSFKSFEKEGNLIKVICQDKQFITDTVVLAIGHSARPTFEMLKESGFEMKKKNFSVGVRIEHLQKTINESQYGLYTRLELPPAEYKLVYHDESGRACYSFCMCPGGEVMASSSEEDGIVTNGMSKFARDGVNSNGALLVNVTPEDLGEDVLSGMYFQRDLEKAAYKLGGSNGNAPVQRAQDFENGKPSDHVGTIIPTYKPGYTLTDINQILPDYVSSTLKKALFYFEKKIKGFNNPDAILTAIETRSSSPVTIERNKQLMSNIEGFYPCGEGAGYAGGITSAAVDGIKVARSILQNNF